MFGLKTPWDDSDSERDEMRNVEKLKDRVETILSTNPYLAQQKLQLETQRGRVVLRGVVNSFFQKQMAQEAVRHVEGVEEVENNLEVDWN